MNAHERYRDFWVQLDARLCRLDDQLRPQLHTQLLAPRWVCSWTPLHDQLRERR
jgi:hypothetical protein